MIASHGLLAILIAPALAAASVPQDSIERARQVVVDSTATILLAQYVSDDTARMIVQRLRDQSRSGSYRGLTDSAFAAVVTRDLRSVNGDLHLRLNVAPPVAPQPGARPQFVGRAEILDGNTGLLELNLMARPSPETIAELRGAFERLANVSALIIDVRRNRGGASTMNDTLWTYFVADSQPTASVFTRSTGTTVERVARPRPTAPRFSSIPVFVLTSLETASAAEGFSFFLQQAGRARVVGSRTAGAGHIVSAFQIGSGFITTISVSRVRNPRTGQEWERVGVIPDVDVPPETALTKALELAIAAGRRDR
jgi:hypothetical protein